MLEDDPIPAGNPPWEEDDAPISRFEFNNLAKKIASLAAEVAKLQAAPADRKPAARSTPDQDPGNLPRGVHVGKTHDWVVENDPWYVQWLDREGKAAGLGFSEEQVEEANQDPRPNPRGRR